MMQFGESLAKLAMDIATANGERTQAAGARSSALSALRAATRTTLSANTARRMAVSRDLSARAAALRERLAAADAALDAEVRRSLAAAHEHHGAKREAIAANAKALRVDLDMSRRDASAKVMKFRAGTRADRAAAAEAMAAALGHFVAGVRGETAELQRAVRDQVMVARGAWGKAAKASASGGMA